MAYTVLVPSEVAKNSGKHLEQFGGYEVRYGGGTDEASLMRNIADVDAIIASHESYTRKIMGAGKKLRCIARFGVGYDAIDIPAATDLGIQVTNTPQALTNAVGEHTIALLLAVAKKVVYMDKQVRKGNWDIRKNDAFMSSEVAGKTLSLVGLGRIGLDVARKASVGLGMRIIAYDPFLPAEKFPEGVAREASLEGAFANADYVSLHLPSTPESRGLIGKGQFSKMRKGSFFINCARGDVVNEIDLADALRNGPMAAAALDVLVDEPPKADNPFLGMENVIILPHTASFTPETRAAMALSAAQSVDELLQGKPLSFPVNKPKGRK